MLNMKKIFIAGTVMTALVLRQLSPVAQHAAVD